MGSLRLPKFKDLPPTPHSTRLWGSILDAVLASGEMGQYSRTEWDWRGAAGNGVQFSVVDVSEGTLGSRLWVKKKIILDPKSRIAGKVKNKTEPTTPPPKHVSA